VPGIDAIVVGSGPNGLAAAITLAQAGVSVQVIEARATLGGGLHSESRTRPGFVHDLCAAVFPMAAVSPFLRALPLRERGIEWIHPPVSVAHPLPDRPAALLAPSMERTLQSLGRDGPAYRRLVEPLLDDADALWTELLAPAHVPRHLLTLTRFGRHAVRSAQGFARAHFQDERVQALFAGLAAHNFLPLTQPITAALGLVLAITAHAPGWPFARGGAGRMADALVAHARGLGVSFETGHEVATIDELPPARAYLFDVAPRHLSRIAGARLPARYRRTLERYRYGPAAFKIDWALSEPIPWRDSGCREASTVHIGGTLEEVAAAEAAISDGVMPADPFILVAQPSLFDPTRAPAGRHTGWAYAHVPHGWTGDATEAIEDRIERLAPGFRDTILARAVRPPAALERENPNLIGGHIIGGVADVRQLLGRPAARWTPYATPDPSIFICSASTPPGAGVHGMCGHHAARAVLERQFSRASPRGPRKAFDARR
jgi:phytoene dehydrogenase-like protein